MLKICRRLPYIQLAPRGPGRRARHTFLREALRHNWYVATREERIPNVTANIMATYGVPSSEYLKEFFLEEEL